MEENLLISGKNLPKQTTDRRAMAAYASVGFFCAAAVAYEGLAPLIIAFFAAILAVPREKMLAGLCGCMPAILLWPQNALVVTGGVAAVGLFALLGHYSRRKWLLWQQSVLLGVAVFLCDALERLIINTDSIFGLSLANGVMAAAVFVLLRQNLSEGEKMLASGELPPRERLIYPALTVMALIVGLSGVEYGGLMPQRILLSVSIMLSLYYGGLACGLSAALLLGLTSVLSGGQDPVIIGYLGICALAAGLGESYGKAGVAIVYGIVGVLLGWFLTDWAGLVHLAAEDLTAGVLLLVWPELPQAKGRTLGQGYLRADNGYIGISQAVGVLGQAVAKPLPAEEETALITGCTKIYALICRNCRSCDYCWRERGEITAQAISEAGQRGWQNGVQGDLLDEDFALSCRHAEAVNEAVIAQVMLGRQQENYRQSLAEYRSICARELALVSKALRSVAFEPSKSRREQYLWQYLHDHGLPVQYVQAEIKNGNMVFSLALKECIEDCETLAADLLSEACHRRYILQKKECGWQEKYCRLLLTPQEKIFIAVNAWQRRAEGEKVCGDLWRHFKLDESRECVLLIDGMGTGEAAYRQSLQAAETLEQLLKNDFPAEDALELVNNHLLLQNSTESFVTLELLLIDILNLRAELYKACGNVSYLLRGEQVQRIEAASLPLGILSDFKSAGQVINLRVNDRLLLLTDALAATSFKWSEILPTLSLKGDEALKQLFGAANADHDDQSAVLIDIWSIKQDG